MKDEDWWDHVLFLALVDVFYCYCQSLEGGDTLLAFPECFLFCILQVTAPCIISSRITLCTY